MPPFLYSKRGCSGIHYALKHRSHISEAVLTCTHILCFEQKLENNQNCFIGKFQVLQPLRRIYVVNVG